MPAAPTGLQTLVPSTILRIPHVALRQVARAHPPIAEALWRECALEAAILAQQVINIGRRASRARVAHLLCELACRYGAAEKQPALVFRFAMTQTHLADVLGLTAVHVNRTLRRLRDEGVISVSGRVLRILDWGRLLDIGEFEAAYLLSPACSSEEGFSAVARLPAQDLRSLTDTLRASPA
jgi:CRP-like cAMP-binding protein